MRKQRRGGLLALLVAGAVAVTTAVSADPAIEITSPANGSKLTRTSGNPEVAVSGTARFDTPAVDAIRRFYLRRDACGSTAGPNNARLSTYAGGTEGGDGCGSSSAGLPNQLFHTLEDDEFGYMTFPAENGVPDVLDDGTVAGRLVFTGFVGRGQAGLAQLEVQLIAGSKTVGAAVVEKTLDPAARSTTYEFTFPIAGTPTGGDLTLRFRMRGVTALNGFLQINNGASYVDVPVLDDGRIMVSTSPHFTEATTQFPTLRSNGTWQTSVLLVPGEHTVYARAVQGDKVAETSSTFTIEQQ